MTRQEIKRHLGFSKGFRYQPSEEERIRIMKELIRKSEEDLKMYKAMLKEKDLY